MHADVEDIATPSIVAVLDGDAVCGTGFVIDNEGGVLTCHHVIDGLSRIRVRTPDGMEHDVNASEVTPAPDIDLALIRVSTPVGPALPLTDRNVAQTRYWTKGYHRVSEAIPEAFPVEGRIIGRTTVTYSVQQQYTIKGAFVLREDEIDHGLSGAPVLDADAAVEIGVFNTRLTSRDDSGGMAIPIHLAANHPALSPMIRANLATVEAYGPYLNLPAAKKLCSMATDRSIDALERLRNVDLQRKVARDVVGTAVSQFIDSDSRIFALIGPSGVGKSTEIVALAREFQSDQLVILIRGSAIDANSQGLDDVVTNTLVDLLQTKQLPTDAATAIAQLAARLEHRLVVMIDALNEAPMLWSSLQEWALRTLSWLRSVDSRLIISARPEAWDFVDEVFDPHSDKTQCRAAQLTIFTDKEYKSAKRAYGVSFDADLSILHLPLAMSLFARSGQPGKSGAQTSLEEVIELFLQEAARAVSKRIGPPYSTVAIISRLREVAAQMLTQDGDSLDQRAVDSILGGATLSEHLVAEGILARANATYRFVYDDVCDWLMAPAVDLDTELRQLGGRNFRRVGAIASALRAVERRDGADALRGRLDSLLDQTGAEEFGTPQQHLIEETLLKIADARPYISVLGRLADSQAGANDHLERFADLAFWRSIPLPLNDRLGLLRDLVTHDDPRPWRRKDWATMPGDWHGADYSPAALAFVLVAENPAEGTPALVSWCADERRLVGGEATVADVAMGILYRLRHHDPEGVWHVINALRMRPPTLCLTICSDDPVWIVKQLVSNGQQTTNEVFVGALYHLARSEVDKQSASVLMKELANRYERGLPPEMVSTAVAVLATWTKQSKYARILRAGYVSNDPTITAYTLVPLVKHAPEVVMPVLTEAINLGGERGGDAMLALSFADDSNTQRLTDDAVLHSLDGGIGPSVPAVCRYIERRTLVSATAPPGLLAVIRAAIAAPNGEKLALLYALTSPAALRGDSQTRTSLLNELIEQADAALLETLLGVVVNQLRQDPPIWEALTTVRKIMPLIDRDSADRVLIGKAHFDRAFAVRLSRWLADGTLEAPGRLTAKLRDRVAAGEAPKSVLKELLGL